MNFLGGMCENRDDAQPSEHKLGLGSVAEQCCGRAAQVTTVGVTERVAWADREARQQGE